MSDKAKKRASGKRKSAHLGKRDMVGTDASDIVKEFGSFLTEPPTPEVVEQYSSDEQKKLLLSWINNAIKSQAGTQVGSLDDLFSVYPKYVKLLAEHCIRQELSIDDKYKNPTTILEKLALLKLILVFLEGAGISTSLVSVKDLYEGDYSTQLTFFIRLAQAADRELQKVHKFIMDSDSLAQLQHLATELEVIQISSEITKKLRLDPSRELLPTLTGICQPLNINIEDFLVKNDRGEIIDVAKAKMGDVEPPRIKLEAKPKDKEKIDKKNKRKSWRLSTGKIQEKIVHDSHHHASSPSIPSLAPIEHSSGSSSSVVPSGSSHSPTNSQAQHPANAQPLTDSHVPPTVPVSQPPPTPSLHPSQPPATPPSPSPTPALPPSRAPVVPPPAGIKRITTHVPTPAQPVSGGAPPPAFPAPNLGLPVSAGPGFPPGPRGPGMRGPPPPHVTALIQAGIPPPYPIRPPPDFIEGQPFVPKYMFYGPPAMCPPEIPLHMIAPPVGIPGPMGGPLPLPIAAQQPAQSHVPTLQPLTPTPPLPSPSASVQPSTSRRAPALRTPRSDFDISLLETLATHVIESAEEGGVYVDYDFEGGGLSAQELYAGLAELDAIDFGFQ